MRSDLSGCASEEMEVGEKCDIANRQPGRAHDVMNVSEDDDCLMARHGDDNRPCLQIHLA